MEQLGFGFHDGVHAQGGQAAGAAGGAASVGVVESRDNFFWQIQHLPSSRCNTQLLS